MGCWVCMQGPACGAASPGAESEAQRSREVFVPMDSHSCLGVCSVWVWVWVMWGL